MRKYKRNNSAYLDNVYDYLLHNAESYTIKELVNIFKDQFNIEINNKALAQYCIKQGIKYKYEKPNKAHSNKPTPIGTEVIKTDGNMVKVKVAPHKWVYKQRKIYEETYNVKLPEDVYVVFLDQDKRNFNIKNLKAITRQQSAILSNDDLCSNNVDSMKAAILCTKLKSKIKEKEYVQNNC